jgi:hypothetical protein
MWFIRGTFWPRESELLLFRPLLTIRLAVFSIGELLTMFAMKRVEAGIMFLDNC